LVAGLPAVAVNVVLLDPDGAVTEAGTVNAALLLLRLTLRPPLEAALVRLTVQEAEAPEARLAGQLTEDNCAPAVSVRVKVRETPFSDAVRRAATSAATAAALAVKVAPEAAAGTVTEAGTVTLALLLDSATLMPPAVAGRLRVTVQDDVPGPATEAGLHTSPLS
jgi:hypothetical protein